MVWLTGVVTLTFEPGQFSPGYHIVPEPEFPGAGEWQQPLFCFDPSGSLAPDPVTRWGTPLNAEIHPVGSEPWVASFASGGLGGVSTFSASPSPRHLVALADGLAYFVDVESPGNGAIVVCDQVRQIVPVENDLLLLVTLIDIVALGPEGPAWRTTRLVLDDLRVEHALRERIVCTGDLLDVSRPEFVLDPGTGIQTHGRRLDSFWPPDAL